MDKDFKPNKNYKNIIKEDKLQNSGFRREDNLGDRL
jgi:hypothetical protein